MFRSIANASLIALIALVLGVSFTQTFAEKPAEGDQPAKQKDEAKKEKAEKAKAPRVYGDYAKIELTDEQKAQIAAIHTEIYEKKKALDKEEEDRSMAVLTDEQKAAITKLRETEAAAKKEKYAKQKAEREAAKAKEGESEKAKSE